MDAPQVTCTKVRFFPKSKLTIRSSWEIPCEPSDACYRRLHESLPLCKRPNFSHSSRTFNSDAWSKTHKRPQERETSFIKLWERVGDLSERMYSHFAPSLLPFGSWWQKRFAYNLPKWVSIRLFYGTDFRSLLLMWTKKKPDRNTLEAILVCLLRCSVPHT